MNPIHPLLVVVDSHHSATGASIARMITSQRETLSQANRQIRARAPCCCLPENSRQKFQEP